MTLSSLRLETVDDGIKAVAECNRQIEVLRAYCHKDGNDCVLREHFVRCALIIQNARNAVIFEIAKATDCGEVTRLASITLPD